MRFVKPILVLLLLLVVGGFLQFYLPSKDVVRIVGTDIKRVDVAGRSGQPETADTTRDVRFINAVWPDGGPRVYRNEETGWGFPWYFKFDSGNLQAEAQNLVSGSDKPKWVLVTHYGWRIPVLSMFPNAVALRQVDSADYSTIPWFNIVFLLILLFVIWQIWRFVARFRAERVEPFIDRLDDEADELVDDANGFFRRLRDRFDRP
ncbi:Protein of unknown function [Tistlia consotensis]|uniref:DUF1523 domain-containing protein n=1 Tax=Tistlia consotensis USBA 355 TaxID=560819 RepID=A0A1Y6CPR8_9PROT|nr:DUF1523 family protein [Tistlia consotensis]SMF80881.1 Protein of unknown function [Tistlia consotensis USBA 355]SNS22014.1 Protein of unknown function [Tistlia consotensis]